MADDARVIHNVDAQSFVVEGAEDTAVLTYRELGDHLTILHTEVGPQHEGKGYGGLLVRAALDYARAAKAARHSRVQVRSHVHRASPRVCRSRSTQLTASPRSRRHRIAAETTPTIAPPATSHVALTR